MIAFLAFLPVLLIGIPLSYFLLQEKVRELMFDNESRTLKAEFRGFWLHDSNVTYILHSLSSEAA